MSTRKAHRMEAGSSDPAISGNFLALAALLAVILAAYYPAWHGGLLWDDDAHLTKAALQSWHGLQKIWFDVGATQQYYPVAHSAFWLMHRLWGDATLGYHLVSIALHAMSAWLFAMILRRLAVPGAWLAACIFALHPVHVESVAWMTELKNTLSGVFYLGAALAYLRFDALRSRRAYVGALALFVLALLSKSVTATLPAALLVVFWWQRGRLRWREDVAPLAPFFAIGIAVGISTAWLERTQIGAEGAMFDFTVVERILIAGRAIWFYLAKLFLPLGLVFTYPRWEISQAAWWQYLYPAGIVAMLAVLWMWRTRSRGPLAAMLLFIGTLFPALGFFNVYPFLYSFVADHFQYLASLGIIALVSAGVTIAARRHQKELVVAALLLAPLPVLTWRQSRQYADGETLYRTTLERNPSSWMAHNNLGWLMLRRAPAGAAGDPARRDAIVHLESALRIAPAFSEAHNNLGTARLSLGDLRGAEAAYREALRLDPGDAEIQYNLGLALERAGRPDEALLYVRESVRTRPDNAQAHATLGSVLQSMGRLDEAIPAYGEALRLNPNDAEAHNNLGSALGRRGRVEEATAHFIEALRLNPASAAANRNLGSALMQLGRFDDAIARFQEAARLQPGARKALYDLANAHNERGVARAQAGRFVEATDDFKDAIRLAPDLAAARENLARLMKMGKG